MSAVGLTNKGLDWFYQNIDPPDNVSLVASIFSDDHYELIEMAKIMNAFDFVALELNWSCPNTESGLIGNTAKIIAGCQEVKKVSRFPLIAKLSVAHSIKEIIPSIKGVVEAISINSVLWKIIFPNKKNPFDHLGGGGVSGKIAQPHTWQLVEELANTTSIPVIGPGVWDFEDIEKLRKKGASAISFGSVFLRYPWRPTIFVQKDMALKQ